MLGLDLLGRVVWLSEAFRISGIDPGHTLEFEMVVAPARPLVQSYDPGKNPFELVDSPSGPMERWRHDALLVGETSALTELIKEIHNDSVSVHARYDARELELQARSDALDQRERQIGVMAAQVADMAGKASVLFDRIQKAKADAVAEPLAYPPGEPSLAQKDDAPAHTPGGELHVIAAKEDPDVEGDTIPGKAPGNPSVTDGDFLRLRHSVTTDQAEFPEGEELPTPPEFKAPAGDELDHKD
jgi:hypothetical protein